MKKTIFALLLTVGVFAGFNASAKESSCEDKAVFASQVEKARDRGLEEKEVTTRITDLVQHHPELGVPEQDLPEMLLLIKLVYHSKFNIESYYEECQKRKAI